MELKIYVAGHRGMVSSAIVHCLRTGGYADIITRTHAKLDLLELVMWRSGKPIKKLGWRASIDLRTGIASSYDDPKLSIASAQLTP